MSDILFLRDLNDGRIKIFAVSTRGKGFMRRTYPDFFPQTEICFMCEQEASDHLDIWKSLGLKIVFH